MIWLMLCDAWRVWIVSTFAAVYLLAPAKATALLPVWLTVVVVVAVYDTAAQIRRGRDG